MQLLVNLKLWKFKKKENSSFLWHKYEKMIKIEANRKKVVNHRFRQMSSKPAYINSSKRNIFKETNKKTIKIKSGKHESYKKFYWWNIIRTLIVSVDKKPERLPLPYWMAKSVPFAT